MPFSLRAQRLRDTLPLSRGRISGLLPRPSRLRLLPNTPLAQSSSPENEMACKPRVVSAARCEGRSKTRGAGTVHGGFSQKPNGKGSDEWRHLKGRGAPGGWKGRRALYIEQLAAELCIPPPDSSRHGMSWIFYRKSAARPEPRFAQEPHGLTPFSRLFRFSASVDHQMTPTLFAGAFRACGPCAPLTGGSAVGHAYGGPPT